MSHIREEMRCSILCVIFEKRWDVQFCASYSRKEMFNSVRRIREKRCSILCVIFEKRDVQFCECHIEKFQFFESHSKNPFLDSLFVEKIQFFESYSKKNLWVILEKWVRFVDSYWKKGFSALSHTFKSSILRVKFSKGSILENHIF